jgi:hypothetical protein
VSQDSKHGKKKEQQDLKDVVSDNNNPWPGLNDFGDWNKSIKLGLEDLKE